MNRNLKRKRRSSDSGEVDSDCDYTQNEKVARYENNSERSKVLSECSSPVFQSEEHESECSSPVPQFQGLDREPSSGLFHSDMLDHASSECGCDTCTQGGSGVIEIHSENPHGTSEVDPDLQILESEAEEPKDYCDLILSPGSHDGYSSCDDRIIGSELISSPIAGSIVDSDFEDDENDNDDDLDDYFECNDDKPNRKNENEGSRKLTGTVVTFMGQLTPGSSVGKTRSPECSTWTSFRRLSVQNELYAPETACPVPQLPWAHREKFWDVMCRKDEFSVNTRNPNLFEYQQYLKPRMRVILLDWISEVAEVFKLHRETYYLALDYIDRYLSSVPNVPKQQLQLIGITCLVLASKMEEIYPPKIDQFANVTDGACTEEEIFSMEVTIIKHLDWLLSPITVNNWLEMMLQFIYLKLEEKNYNLLTPHFLSTLFKRLCQLLDLVTLDVISLRYSYCILAASAIYILVDPKLAISISGLRQEALQPCVQWMSVFWKVLRETYSPEMADVSDLLKDRREGYHVDQHPELQTHNISMQLYELVQAEFESLEAQAEKQQRENTRILTPPPSSSKSVTTVGNEVDSTC